MRPLPTTLEILEAYAMRDARRIALREGGVELGIGQLYVMAHNCAAELHALGVRPGHRVAVAGPGFALQLIVLFACEAIGAVTASFQAEGDHDAPFLFELVDWVVAARPQQVPEGKRFLLLDDAFARHLTQPLRPGERPWHPLQGHELQRITRTSGSTGRSKFMALSRAAQEYWVRGTMDIGYGAQSRLVVTGPLVINAAYSRTTRCLRYGGVVMVGSGHEVAQMAPTDIWGLPALVERFLDEMPADWVSPHPVSVATVGGAVPPALRERLRRVFGGFMPNRYGSNEAGPICDMMDETGTGAISPGVDVRILGPDGADLPLGQYGKIAVRTPCLAEGYVGEAAQENAALFRDGWFISADVGALVAPRILRLAGRQDDLLNLGGIKVPAAQVEADLRKLPAVAACAVLAVHLENGKVNLGVALVLADGATQDQARAQLATLKLDITATLQPLFLAELPMLHTGKVDRLALLRQFRGG